MATTSDKNAARRCGKAWKKKPGVSANANSGKTAHGYTAEALARRAAKRAAKTPA